MYKKKWKKHVNTFIATSLVASVAVPAAPIVTTAETLATDLIISEYIEGSSFNKAIEIYNGTGAPVDLSEYTLELHSNGEDPAKNKVSLTGTLEHGDVYVVYHKDANPAIKAVGDLENSTVINFNGDDPIVLRKSGVVVDSIGQVGVKVSNKADVTLVRKSTITNGDTIIDDAFDPTSEWTNLGKDNFSNIGFHTMEGGSVSPPGESKVAVVSASQNEGTVSVGTTVALTTTTENATIYYTTDGSEPTKASKVYSADEPIVISETTTIKAFASAEGLSDSDVKQFTYTVITESDILSIQSARKQGTGDVTVKGVVTALLKNTLHFEDGTAAIAVYPKLNNVKVGDEITVKGTLTEYQGLLQLQSPTLVGEPEAKGETQPTLLTGAQLNEDNESKLATIKNVELTAVTGTSWKNYTANDGTEFFVRDENGDLDSLAVGTTYESITGIVQEFNGTFQIVPRGSSDIVEDATMLKPAIATLASGTYVGKQSVKLSTTTANAEIYYTLDGSVPNETSTKYNNESIEITEDTTLKAIVISKDGTSSEVSEFVYKITDALQIHDIQGEDHVSPFKGQGVSDVQGIVTYKYKLGNNNYFHLQTPDDLKDDNPKTSEGIIVFTGNTAENIAVGDFVSVTGTVDEYQIDGYSDTKQETDLSVTQINARNDRGGVVAKLSSGHELPAAVTIDATNLPSDVIDNDGFTQFDPEEDAIDFWESLEGMLVEVGNVKAVAPQEHGDLITVLENRETNTLHGGVKLTEQTANPDRIQFKLYDNNEARDFEVATGDKFTGPIQGVVNYGFQNYKIYADLEDMKAKHVKGNAKPETTTIIEADDKLTIASYNLENFSNNTSSTSKDKAEKLARAFVQDMESPDIIGVTEVQDNNGASSGDSKADQSYERLIQAIVDAGGPRYKYLNIDPVNNQDGGAPNANIRVGFLYNADRVDLPDGITSGNATTAVGYENGNLTLNPGRIDPNNSAFNSSRKPLAAQFDFQGEDVIVIVNHWNSKSGDTPLFGSTQPPVYGSEVQRKKIAQIVYDFVEDIKSKNPDANVVSVGDFNDYQFSEALKIHEGNHMTNMINHVEENDRYTYLFQGNSQVLDHILVSNNLVKNTEIDILHINADFTDMAGRASDHDPVMVQIDLKASGDEETPISEQRVYSIADLSTTKLIFNKENVKVDLDGDSVIANGIFFYGQYVELSGEGFAENSVTIKPEKAGAIIDLKGTKVKELIIDGTNVKEIRGAENATIKYENGASKEQINVTDSEGAPIGDPSFPSKAPVVALPISNKAVTEGEEIIISLLDHFSDPNNDSLIFSSTKGSMNGDTLTLSLPVGAHIVGVTATDGEFSVTTQFSVTVSAKGGNSDYYAEATGKTGTALKSALHEIISEQRVLSYDQVWEALRVTDEDPNNSNNVLLFYSGISRSKSSNGGNVGDWNREHVWAKSHGDFGTSKGPGTDIHHLRATDTQVNSSRGNLDFDYGGTSVKNCDLCKRDSDSFEPPNNVKGDVARMLFYMAVRYESGDRVDLELNEKVNNGKNPYHGKLSVLLEWHKNDPVDEIEKRRNEKIFEIQGNRNPFIDNPEWAKLIWN